MTIRTPKAGDFYLLFHQLPFEFDQDLPLNLGPDVCLDSTPQSVLDKVDPALADYLLPGYNLPGMGLNNCCLRCYARKAPDLNSSDLFFVSLSALRLRAPIGIRIAGQFKLSPKDGPVAEPSLYEMCSSWQPDQGKRFSSSDIIASAAIARRIIQISRSGYKRMVTAIVFFSQVTLGFSRSFQLSYLGLFAALEALFVPEGSGKGNILGRRVSRFLKKFSFPENLEDWIRKEYSLGRNKLAHGVHDASLETKMRASRSLAFGRLHEITRLCILGFISMKGGELLSLSSMTGKGLQAKLDTLSPASGRFIRKQQMWLG
jgi:hypothetical protein